MHDRLPQDSSSHFDIQEKGCLISIESALAAFFSTLFSLGAIGIAIMMLYDATTGRFGSRGSVAILSLILLLGAPLTVWHTAVVWRHLSRGLHPVALTAALRVVEWSWWVKLLSLPWWTLCYSFAVAGVIALELDHNAKSREPFLYGMVFLYNLAANCFLMALLATIGLGNARLRRIWSWRLLIDLALALVPIIVAE